MATGYALGVRFCSRAVFVGLISYLAYVGSASCAPADSGNDLAKNYPNRPIRLIAQFLPGTTTDIIARFIGGRLTEAWDQHVVVDNRPGAGGQLGTDLAAKAAPDGYTLAIGAAGALGIAPGLVRCNDGLAAV